MAKKLLSVIVILVGIAAVVFAVHSYRAMGAGNGFTSHGGGLPGKYADIKLGQSESDIHSLVGDPKIQSVNKMFERKSDAQWAAIEAKAFVPADGDAVYAVTPSMDEIKAGAEYEHRFRDLWTYQPTPANYMTLYFGANKTLLKVSFSPAPKVNKPVD